MFLYGIQRYATYFKKISCNSRALWIESSRQRGVPGTGPLSNISGIGHHDVMPKTQTNKSLIEDLTFHDSSIAFKEKSSKELLRAYAIFTMCSVDKIVDHQAKLLKWTRALLGERLFRRLMKATVYGQFEGGETREEVLTTGKRLSSHGVIPLFAYTAAEVHGVKASAKGKGNENELTIESAQLFWEKNFEAMIESLEITAASRGYINVRPKMTGKLTFLMSARSLRQLTDIIVWNEKVVTKIMTAGQKPEIDQLKTIFVRLGKQSSLITGLSDEAVGSEMINLVRGVNISMALIHDEQFQEIVQEPCPVAPLPNKEEVFRSISKITELAKRAAELGVTWVIDAEQTYLQTGIDAVVLDLMRDFNRQYAVIHNTYQCYLKRTHDIIRRDLNIAKTENFCLGAKVVRGAYIDEERRLACELGYDDPINNGYDATTKMYDMVNDKLKNKEVVHELLSAQTLRSREAVDLIVASHNEETVKKTIQKCIELGITLDGSNVIFAQTYGMRDHIAYTLGHHALPGGKLIHYGDVVEGIAYLSRRILENRGGLPTAALERKMIGSELSKRIFKI